MVSHTCTTIPELASIATELIESLPSSAAGATVLALHGDLGAGKTTLVQLLATTLGIIETVTSPTFVVMKQYETNDDRFTALTHIDAYRIESDDEMRPLGFSEILREPHTLICIEWAENIEALLPEATVHVSLVLNPDQTRTLTYGNKN